MDPDTWTPGRGWLIGLGQAALRSAMAGLVFGVILYIAWPMTATVPQHWAFLALAFIVTAAVGYPMGLIVGRKLSDDSGLAGRSLAFPVFMILLAAQVGTGYAVGAIRGEPNILIFSIAAGVIVWSAAACVKTVLLE